MKRLISKIRPRRRRSTVFVVLVAIGCAGAIAGLAFALGQEPWSHHRLASMNDNRASTRVTIMPPGSGELTEVTAYATDGTTAVRQTRYFRNGDVATIQFARDGETIASEQLVRSDGTVKEERTPLAQGEYQVTAYATDGKSITEVSRYNRFDTLLSRSRYDSTGTLVYASETRSDGSTLTTEFYSDGDRKLVAINGNDSHATLYYDNGAVEATFKGAQYSVKADYFRKDGSLADQRVFSYDGSVTVTVYDSQARPLYRQLWNGGAGSGYDPPYTLSTVTDLDSGGHDLLTVQMDLNGKHVASVSQPVPGHPGWSKTTSYRADGSLENVEVTDSANNTVSSRNYPAHTRAAPLLDNQILTATAISNPPIVVPTSGPYDRWGE